MFCPVSQLQAFVSVAITASFSLPFFFTLFLPLSLCLSLSVSLSVRTDHSSRDHSSLGDVRLSGCYSVACQFYVLPLRPALTRRQRWDKHEKEIGLGDNKWNATLLMHSCRIWEERTESRTSKTWYMLFLPWGSEVLDYKFHSPLSC